MATFSPFEHQNELVFTNQFGDGYYVPPIPDTVKLPDGTSIATAIPGEPGTLTFWLPDSGGAYHEITRDQAFVQSIYLHFLYGAPVLDPIETQSLHNLQLDSPYHVTVDALRGAFLAMPTVMNLIAQDHFTADQVLAYVEAEAPGVVLVGMSAAETA
jgi:hypothetical protein